MSLFAEDFDGPSDCELQTENDEGDGVVVAVTSFAGRTDQDDINLTDWMEDWQSNSQPGNADENYKSSPIDKGTKFKLVKGAAVAQRCTDALLQKITMNLSGKASRKVNMPTRSIADQLLYSSFTMQQGKAGEPTTMYLPATIVIDDLENVPIPSHPRPTISGKLCPIHPHPVFLLPKGYRTGVRPPQRGDQALSMCSEALR